MLGGVAVILMLAFISVRASAGTTGQKTFKSPEKAVQAFVDSLRKKDAASLKSILGPDSAQLLSSGDPVQDRLHRERFLAAYDESQRLDHKGKKKVILVVGKDEWPFPIPLAKQDGQWFFDTAAGKDELLNRRIGRNERLTLQSVRTYVEAQREYAMKDRDGDIILVSPGTPIRKGDRVLVKTKAGEVMVKALRRRTAKTLELTALDASQGDRTLAAVEVAWIARIVWASQ